MSGNQTFCLLALLILAAAAVATAWANRGRKEGDES